MTAPTDSTLTDREINQLFADRVEGLCVHRWRVEEDEDSMWREWVATCEKCGDERHGAEGLHPVSGLCEPYLSSVDAVLPAVERLCKSKGWICAMMSDETAGQAGWSAWVGEVGANTARKIQSIGLSTSLARALVLASLRAVGEDV